MHINLMEIIDQDLVIPALNGLIMINKYTLNNMGLIGVNYCNFIVLYTIAR